MCKQHGHEMRSGLGARLVQEVQQGPGRQRLQQNPSCPNFQVEVMTAEWAKHQLKDPEILQEPAQHTVVLAAACLPAQDLLILRGPLFQAMNEQQREAVPV